MYHMMMQSTVQSELVLPFRAAMPIAFARRVIVVCAVPHALLLKAVRHTFIDGTMDVACSVFAINVLRLHPLSRAAYNVVIIGLITELHAG